ILRSVFFSLAASAGLLYVALQTRSPIWRAAIYFLAAFSLIPGPYLWNSYYDIIMRGALSVFTDQVIFVGLLVLTLVLVRRTLGWALFILSAIALLYA